MARPIDATALVKLVLEERDKIPLEVVERYSFGVRSPNKHGQSMRGGIRKVLRLIEQAPTLDYVPLKRGKWGAPEIIGYDGLQAVYARKCSECGCYSTVFVTRYCPNCGALMDEKEEENANHLHG